MRKFRKLTIGMIGAVLLSTGLYSCNNDDVVAVTEQSSKELNVAHREGEQAIPEVQKYYNNLKTIIVASEIYNYDVAQQLEKEEVPLLEKLKKMDLENDETRTPMTFWDLKDKETVIDFVDQYFDEEALTVSNKIANSRFLAEEDKRTLIDEFVSDNEIIEEVMKDFNVIDFKSTISNKSEFFSKLNNKFRVKIPILDLEDIEVTFPVNHDQILKNKLVSSNTRRGDIFVALPKHGKKYSLVNFKNRFVVGHAGIVTKDITNSTNLSDIIGVEAWNWDVVRNTYFSNWSKDKFYVMEFKKKRTRVIIKWFKVKIQTSYHDVNRNAFANYVTGKLGRPYVSLGEFPAMKFVAKNKDKYTCTTLIWKAADVTIDIAPAPWLSPIVTPGNIYNDSETFTKANIN